MPHIYVGIVARLPQDILITQGDLPRPRIVNALSDVLKSFGASDSDFTYSWVHVLNDDDDNAPLRIIYDGYMTALEGLEVVVDQKFSPGNRTELR